MVKTLVIPAIKGGQGLNPVRIPDIKGILFVYFLFIHLDFSLSDSRKPLIPQKINNPAINSLEKTSIAFIKVKCIPINEKTIPTSI